MIKVEKGAFSVEGTSKEILEDLRDLVLDICLRNNKHYITSIVGYQDENINNILSLDSLLRMIYTCYSVSEESFNELLKENREILEEVKTGEFKLIYKHELEDDEEFRYDRYER